MKIRFLLAIMVACGSVVLAAIAGTILTSWTAIPYSVREVFAENGASTACLLWMTLAVYLGSAWSVARLWQRRPLWGAAAILPAALVTAPLAYVILNLTVPAESLDDVVGTPVLEMSSFLERGWRFLGLLAAPFIAWILGIRTALGRFSRWDLVGLLFCGLGLAGPYAVVVLAACTDNLIELMPSNGKSWKVVAIPAWLVVSGSAATLAAAPREALRLRFAFLHSIALVILSTAPAWGLATSRFTASLEKYEARFSGLQFLLSASRAHYAVGWELFARFCLLHLVMVGSLAACGFVVVAFLCRAADWEGKGDSPLGNLT